MIRPAEPEDLTAVQDIEVAAGMKFADVGMPEIALDPATRAVMARRGDHKAH